MQRSLSGVLFLVAAVAIALAAGGWWMQRIVFTPDSNRDTAAAILEDPDIRQELNTIITFASAQTLETTTTELGSLLETVVLTSRPGAEVMAPLIERAHNRIIGIDGDEEVIVTGSEMIPIVRDERAASVAEVTLPISPIGVLKSTRGLLGWLIPIAAGLGLLLALLGIVARPERRDISRGLGELGLALAAAMLLFGYAIPVFLLTAIDNSTWTHAIPRLALRTLPVVLGTAAILALSGLALIFAPTSGSKRRQWSTPLSATRYRGGDNPGWR
jgi:hypothetical protein